MSKTVKNLKGESRVMYKALDWYYRKMVQTKDPVQFIDLLAFNNYIAGQIDNNIPV